MMIQSNLIGNYKQFVRERYCINATIGIYMQDSINTDKFPYKVNAVTLMEYNEELRDLCLETGGKLIQVDESERVYAHSKEAGQQEITKKQCLIVLIINPYELYLQGY